MEKNFDIGKNPVIPIDLEIIQEMYTSVKQIFITVLTEENFLAFFHSLLVLLTLFATFQLKLDLMAA